MFRNIFILCALSMEGLIRLAARFCRQFWVVMPAFYFSMCWCGNTRAEEVLLYDDFSSESLDASLWDVANWSLGRTDFGSAPSMESENLITFARFSLETYSPDNPGTNLLGSAIYSDRLFSCDNGLVFEARMRVVNADTPGQVAAFFSYEEYDGASDEIDYEFLTSQNTDQVLLTSWDNWASGYTQNDGVHHADASMTVNGMDISEWTTVRFYWKKGRVQWEINGTRVHEETVVVPDQSMKLHVSLWAPESSWTAAYSASLAPVLSSELSTAYYMDVDYVKVYRLPSAQPPAVFLLLQN